MPFDGSLIEVKRGQKLTSIRKLCERWGWSNTKVTKFLKLLETDGMITYFSDTKKTLITIVNYSDWQDNENKKTSQKRHRNISETSQKHTNNNDKECIKNDKEVTPLENAIEDFKKFRIQSKKAMTDRAVNILINKLDKLASDDETKIKILEQSIFKGWTDIYPLKADYQQPQSNNQYREVK